MSQRLFMRWPLVRRSFIRRAGTSMRGLLADKVAIVTGAGSGVGREATILFAQHGAKVLASDINLAAVEESVALAKQQGGTARATTCDVSDSTSVAALVKTAIDAYGQLDVMYNNAGVTVSAQPGKGIKQL